MAKRSGEAGMTREGGGPPCKNEHCCCPPRALVWIDTRTQTIFVENAVGPQGRKAQGKVYRTDLYTVHWKAEGTCPPLEVTLYVTGAITPTYEAKCLPAEGEVTLSRAYMMEPPNYDPVGMGTVTARLEVSDCSGKTGCCQITATRP